LVVSIILSNRALLHLRLDSSICNSTCNQVAAMTDLRHLEELLHDLAAGQCKSCGRYSDSAALPMCARVARQAGLAFQSSHHEDIFIHLDFGHNGPVSDHPMRFPTSWKMSNLALKIIATFFNPGQKQLEQLHPSNFTYDTVTLNSLYFNSCDSTCNQTVAMTDPRHLASPSDDLMDCQPQLNHKIGSACLTMAAIVSQLVPSDHPQA